MSVQSAINGWISEIYDNIAINLTAVILEDVDGNRSDAFSNMGNSFTPTEMSDKSGFSFTRNYNIQEILKKRVCQRNMDGTEAVTVSEASSAEVGSGEVSAKRPKLENDKDLISFDDPLIKKAVSRLKDCLDDKNMECWYKVCQMKEQLSEKDLVVAIGVHLVKKLTGEAYSKEDNAKTECPCGCDEKVEVADMWIGHGDIWHGELDLLSGDKSSNILIDTSVTEEDSDESDNENFSATDIDVKTDLCQMCGESIVFSFTEHNRNPDFSPLVPTILISNDGFTVCIYDCLNDEMHLATGCTGLPEDVMSKNKKFGIFLLWLCLNNRLFFRKELKSSSKYIQVASGFLKSLRPTALKKYNELKHFSKVLRTTKGQKALKLTKDYDKYPVLFTSNQFNYYQF